MQDVLTNILWHKSHGNVHVYVHTSMSVPKKINKMHSLISVNHKKVSCPHSPFWEGYMHTNRNLDLQKMEILHTFVQPEITWTEATQSYTVVI